MSDILNETVKSIAQFAVSGAGFTAAPKLVSLPNERSGIYGVENDDKLVVKLAEPAWHGETLESPRHLAEFAAARQRKDSAIYVSDGLITMVYDFEDRRDKAICEMKHSQQWDWLIRASGNWMTQEEIVRLLRITFRGCIDSVPGAESGAPDREVVDILRKLKVIGGSIQEGEIQQGRESFGKSITGAVQQSVPEEICLNIPIYTRYPLHVRIACALEINPMGLKLKITPFPREMEIAQDRVLSQICDDIRGNVDPHALPAPDDDAATNRAIKMPPVYRGVVN